jgi:hypothetical protein
MENSILKLIKIISLIYLNSLVKEKNKHLLDEIRDYLYEINIDGKTDALLASEESAIVSLKDTADWLLANSDEQHTKENIIQRLKINLYGKNDYIKIVEEYLNLDFGEDISKGINGILSELRFSNNKTKLAKLVNGVYSDINYNNKVRDVNTYVRKMIDNLTELQTNSSSLAKGVISSINFTDVNQIENAIDRATKEFSTEGMLSSGFRGINKALGGLGYRRGEYGGYGGLSYCYKTGKLYDECVDLPMYNKPFLYDETKLPAIIRISFETTEEQDIEQLYRRIYRRVYKEDIEIDKIDKRKAAEFIQEYYNKYGFTFLSYNISPSGYTPYDLINLLQSIIDDGYEIIACVCDYINKLAKNVAATNSEIQYLTVNELVRNFTAPKKITFITAHQINKEARKIKSVKQHNFLKEIDGLGLYHHCGSLDQVYDFEIYIDVYKAKDGKVYFIYQRGKHRNNDNTPEAHKFGIYEFHPTLGLMPDIDGQPSYMVTMPVSGLDPLSDELDSTWE